MRCRIIERMLSLVENLKDMNLCLAHYCSIYLLCLFSMVGLPPVYYPLVHLIFLHLWCHLASDCSPKYFDLLAFPALFAFVNFVNLISVVIFSSLVLLSLLLFCSVYLVIHHLHPKTAKGQCSIYFLAGSLNFLYVLHDDHKLVLRLIL